MFSPRVVPPPPKKPHKPRVVPPPPKRPIMDDQEHELIEIEVEVASEDDHDPKASGMNLGYDQAVALPAMQADGKSGQEERSYKQWTQWSDHEPRKKNRRGQRRNGRRGGRGRKLPRLGINGVSCMVDVRELRHSQLSIKQKFQCGRSVKQLVQDLLDRKVRLSARFLRLTVFETTDERTNETILKCIDNRRLWALKRYARRSRDYLVNVKMFSESTVMQVQHFLANSDSDATDGRDIFIVR